MTEYQPGRIYSGVVLGKRRLLFCGRNTNVWFSWVNDHGMLRFSDLPGDVTDVRGPLVVLDLDDAESRVVHEELRRVFRVATDKAADQIEAQTTPPLQVGWHECIEAGGAVRPFWWDGEAFQFSPESSRPILLSVRSVAYLGKGTRA